MELILFGFVALVAIAAAIGMLLSRNAVHSALFLIMNFGCVAFLFLMLDAPFISMVQIAVYAGAIMVLFLFVIMLLGAERTTDATRSFRRLTGIALILALVFLAVVGLPIVSNQFVLPEPQGKQPMIRVFHASTEVPAVNVVIQSDEETISMEAMEFGDSAGFLTLAPGEYTVTMNLAEPEIPLWSRDLSLSGDDIYTMVAFGSPREGNFSVSLLEDDLSPVEPKVSRLTVLNTFSTEPVTLVDVGPNGRIDLREQPVENGEGGMITARIRDVVLVEELEFGESAQLEIAPGAYDLRFITAQLADLGLDIVTVRAVKTELEEGLATLAVLAGEPLPFENASPRPILLELEAVPVPSFGSPKAIGQILFTTYLLPVQVVGVLLLVALIGVVALTRPEPPKRAGIVRRRRVSRPLVSVIAAQTGSNIFEERPQLDAPASQPEASGD